MTMLMRYGVDNFSAPRSSHGLAFASAGSMVRAAVRAAVAEEIERLIGVLDALDAEPDLEPGGDDEPSLGWLEGLGHEWTGPERCSGQDDREDDAGDDREPDEDREPALGWTKEENQASPHRFGDVWRTAEDEEDDPPGGDPVAETGKWR